jgi:hypothetical protein
MRILNETTDSPVDNILLLLTRQEATQIISYLGELLSGTPGDHFHVESEDFQREITLALCEADDIETFSPRIKRLILDGT